MTISTLSTLPAAPNPGTMTRAEFNAAAEAYVLALLTLQSEINTIVGQVNALGITTITGSIQNTPIGNVTPSTGAFTTLSVGGTNLAASGGSALIGHLPSGGGAIATTVQQQLRNIQGFTINVKDAPYYAQGDGVANDTAAFTAARTATGGYYYIPAGNYILDASPDVFADAFTSGDNVTLTIAGTPYNCSNAFCGPLRYQQASFQKTNIVHAKTGNIIMYMQDGSPGTATGFYRGLAFTTDSHWVQMQPATNGGSTDMLWQRSTLNADPNGNRFNETFDEANDRLLFSYATTLSGAPSFDSAIIVGAGTSPYMTFPALRPQFNAGISVKQRAAGGYEFTLEQSSSTQAKIRELGGAETTYMTFRTGAFGFFGSAGTSQQTITGSRGGNVALANLLTALANTGLIIDNTTA